MPLLLAALVAGFLIVNDDSAHRVGNFRPTVGLVNEDLSAEFNSETYAFGASFIDRISKDSEYNWTVISRPVAEKAYKDGSVDAVLYIPQSFSHDILTLQETSPTKATVEYRLRQQTDESADRLLETRIRDIVQGFNRSVVTMYYASLADNIAEADGHMHAALGIQKALITALTSDVQKPFATTMPTFESLLASATGLKDIDAAASEAQTSFTKSVMDLLTSNGQALSGQLPGIEEYTSRQSEIAQINAANGNRGIEGQAESDRDFYGAQFEWFRTGMLCKLNGLDASEVPVPCADPEGAVPPHLQSRIAELRQAIAQYAEDYALSMKGVFDDLDERIRNLRAIELALTLPASPTDPAVPDPSGPDPDDPDDPEDPDGPDGPAQPAPPSVQLDPAILRSLHREIRALETARDSLSASTMPTRLFESELTNLETWYADVLTAAKDASLATSAVTSLDIQDWSTYSPDDAGLFVDNSDELRTSITGLLTQSAEASGTLTGLSTTLPDNSSLFDALFRNSTTTASGAEKALSGVNALLTSGNSGLEQNQAYYANFATVLANTRTPGVDTGSIYSFFSAPIDAKNVTPDRAAAASTADPIGMLDLNWLIVFAGGLLAGAVVTALGSALRRGKKA
ncbi:hypothetical protein ASF88_03795 [Leifsonia sp. Leaf336]|nr:hypothetical protein ASF88_03795 [Leifsonia sp. Leaf336]